MPSNRRYVLCVHWVIRHVFTIIYKKKTNKQAMTQIDDVSVYLKAVISKTTEPMFKWNSQINGLSFFF